MKYQKVDPAKDRRKLELINLASRRFGQLVVLKYVGRGDRNHYWECKCDCGELSIANSKCLLSGMTTSCGCYRMQRMLKSTQTHGHTANYRTPEYKTWQNMRSRCENPNAVGFHAYGGRGVRVCEEWRLGDGTKSGFECFLADIGPRPTEKHSLDRINVDGNYEPGNCRWADNQQQQRNRRDNIWVEVDGRRMLISDAIEKLDIPRTSFYRLLDKGISLKEAITASARRQIESIAVCV